VKNWTISPEWNRVKPSARLRHTEPDASRNPSQNLRSAESAELAQIACTSLLSSSASCQHWSSRKCLGAMHSDLAWPVPARRRTTSHARRNVARHAARRTHVARGTSHVTLGTSHVARDVEHAAPSTSHVARDQCRPNNDTSTRASLKHAPPPRSVSVSGTSAVPVAPL